MPRRGEKKDRQPAGNPDDPRGWSALIFAFLEWMRVTGHSERTVGNRADALDQLARWCIERSLLRPGEVTKPVLDRYQRHLFYYRKKNGKPLSFRSQHSRLVPVRALFRWLSKNNFILSNPASELELPRLEKRLPRAVLTAGEAEQILAQPDTSTLLGLRDRTMLEVFYSTGMRRMELIGLDLYAVDAERGTIMVRQGKGKKDRMIPIGERAVAWLQRYLDDVRPELATEPDPGALFLTHDGQPFTENRLTQLARGYVNAAGLPKKGACHLFRHTMATLMLEGGADIRYIQAMLGHADLSTTQIYTQVSIRKLAEVHAATHPGARLGPRQADDDASGDDDATPAA